MSIKVPKGRIVVDYREGKEIKCPECGGRLLHTGERKTTHNIHCEKCNFKIIVD